MAEYNLTFYFVFKVNSSHKCVMPIRALIWTIRDQEMILTFNKVNLSASRNVHRTPPPSQVFIRREYDLIVSKTSESRDRHVWLRIQTN